MWYIFGCIFLILILKYHWSRRRIYQLANLMDGPPAIPIFGNALMFHCKEEDLFERITKTIDTHSSPVRIWAGPKLVVAVKSAPQIEKVFTTQGRRDDLYRFLSVFNGTSLFTSEGPAWKQQKRLVVPFLGSRYMEPYVKLIARSCRTLIEKLEENGDGKLINIDYYLYRCYNDIVTETLTGHNPGAQHGKIDFIISMAHEAYILLHSRFMKVWLHPDFIFERSTSGKRQKYISATFRKFLHKNISLGNNNDEFKSIYDNILEQQEKYPQCYGNQNLMDHIATLYSAAEDTTTSICSFLILLLGMHPHIQDKAVKEIEEVFGDSVEDITFKHLSKLHFLGMCIKETMRLFPIAPYILKNMDEDVQFDNVTIPKEVTVVVSLYSIHRSSQHWEKPNEFYPEHFLPETVAKRNPYAYLPFSTGTRSCPGQLFALCAIKAVAASILSRFVVEASGTVQDIKIKADISIRPVNGYKILLRKKL